MNENIEGHISKATMDAIGDAIRDRNGLLTKYLPSEMPTAIESIPNNYTLADEGKVVKNGELVAQTARATAITENGTYDTTENNEVTVSVSGGGGNIPVILQADWDAMTTAQKQSYGLCVIQTASSGFARGKYVNGADYIPFDVLYSGTGSNSASQSVNLVSNAKLLVIAMNSEASTKQLTTSAVLDGTELQGTQISYHSYFGAGENRRNYRITAFDIPSGSHSLDISLTTENNYSSFVYVVLESVYYTINKELTTADGITSGSNTANGMVIYGTFNSRNGGTINTELYTADTTIITQNPGTSYQSSYIFWFV